jgi:uncharacterized protein YchJ
MTYDPLFPRRQPCPCGSGKKFKECCEVHVSGDRAVAINAERLMQRERFNPGLIQSMAEGFEQEIARRTTQTNPHPTR